MSEDDRKYVRNQVLFATIIDTINMRMMMKGDLEKWRMRN
jgi:hypothetical protein